MDFVWIFAICSVGFYVVVSIIAKFVKKSKSNGETVDISKLKERKKNNECNDVTEE